MSPADFPSKLRFLFKSARYKVAYGGRGGSKSWGFARALLILGAHKRLRVLCAREIQKSIKDSVHKLLSDQIVLLGLESEYDVLDQEIRGKKNGTEFIFVGLAQHTVTSIKSYEGCDIVWVEEAQVITNRSWQILIPTIRKDGSEIWISFNPELETDPTYERFVVNTPDDAIVVKMNWRDNPWFNEVLDKERLHCLKTDPVNYPNIWEGECKPAVEGAIFFEEMQAMKRMRRIRNVPYDPMLLAHVVLDLGYNDALATGIVQRLTSEIRVIWYKEYTHTRLSDVSANLREMNYNWGKVWLPFADGFSKSSKGQDSAEDIMKKLKWKVAKKSEVSSLGVEQGIKTTRERFPRVYIDETNCERLIECLRRYRRSINKVTMEAGAPLHDEFSHGGDFFRYVCINADQMDNAVDEPVIPVMQPYHALDAAVGY